MDENNNGLNNTNYTGGSENYPKHTYPSHSYPSHSIEPDEQVPYSGSGNTFYDQADYFFSEQEPPIFDEAAEKKRRSRSEKALVAVFVLILITAVAISIFGIVYDVLNSEKALGKLNSTQKVVLYREHKPEGANAAAIEKDENGRYTIEGAAALVKPSIIKIYTYSTPDTLQGTGSGIVLSKDGYIVTNAHVLLSNGTHFVETVDGKKYNAKIIGRDAKTDIAVIKITADNLIPATLGDSDDTIVGESVIAIGNPANLSSTVTNGIVSAVNRKIRGDSSGFMMNCIQTNADISPGNSGGALINMYGQVIGITSSKYVSSTVEGLGFAITINEALPVIEELMDNGFIAGRFRIGIQLIDMSKPVNIASVNEALGFEMPEDFKGVYIADISKDCDIANTELKVGDFITAINGKTISTYDELYNTISSMYKAGDTVPATCAHLTKDGEINYYNIEFKLMEDTSGDF